MAVENIPFCDTQHGPSPFLIGKAPKIYGSELLFRSSDLLNSNSGQRPQWQWMGVEGRPQKTPLTHRRLPGWWRFPFQPADQQLHTTLPWPSMAGSFSGGRFRQFNRPSSFQCPSCASSMSTLQRKGDHLPIPHFLGRNGNNTAMTCLFCSPQKRPVIHSWGVLGLMACCH